MVKSIYGFAKSAQSSGSIATEAIRLYNRAVLQSAGEAGVVDNPDIYKSARETYLEPYADDIRVSTKIAESVNDQNKLSDKINDVSLAVSVFKSDFSDIMKENTKAYYKNPSNLVLNTAYLYNTAIEELDDEIESRKARGESVGDLQSLMNTYSVRADNLTKLARQFVAGGKPQNPNAYGWFVKTNPDDGSIVDMTLEVVDSTDSKSGYLRTNSNYGNIPVWSNTVVDSSGKEIARIGANKYEKTKDKDGNITLKSVGRQWGRYVKSFIPGGESPTQVASEEKNLNLNGIQFSNVLNLPKGSVAKDAADNYYYFGNDGIYKANNKENLQQYLNFSGVENIDVDAMAFPVSKNEVKNFGSFTNEDGSSRIIDESLLSGISQKKQLSASALPSLDQSVKGTFSSVPAPATKVETSSFIVPRKSAGVKTESQVGRESSQDIINNQGELFSSEKGLSSLFRK